MKLCTTPDEHVNCGDLKEEQLERETREGDFENFKLSEGTIQKLRQRSIEYLFPVQAKTFKPILSGKDAIVRARTGTGKTMAFALPVVEKLGRKPALLAKKGRAPQVLVLAPTRELAKQIGDDFASVSSLKTACVYGGVPYAPQEQEMAAGCDVVAGTPGRVLDYLERAKSPLLVKKLKFVILDEVDRMLDMGFAESVEKILTFAYKKPKPPQTLLFSATLPNWVHDTAAKYMRADKQFSLDLVGLQANKTSTTVQHLAIKCSYFRRAAVCGDVLSVYSGRYGRAMVFCEKKKDADDLAVSTDIKQDTHVMHGDIPQAKRELVLKGFREGRYQVLITTDVAARGLDIPEVDLVVQTSPPVDVDSYIHRSGRTGRAGRTGTCICFYKPQEEYALQQVERTAGIKFKRIGPPTSEDIIKAAADDAGRALQSVTSEMLDHFRQSAERLVQEKGAVEALAAALAVISGSTEIKERSLVTAQEGLTTFHFTTNTSMLGLGYCWNALERSLGPEVKEKVQNMRMCSDKQGAVFDLPTELCSYVDDHWEDGNYNSLKRATNLPQLVEYQATKPDSRGRGGWWGASRGSRGGFRSSNRGSRGGFRGFSGRSRGGIGSQKRGFSGSSRGAPSAKRFKS